MQNHDPTIQGFCQRHHVCRQTVYNEINAGRLRTYKVGIRGVRISPHAEAEWIKSRETFVKRCKIITGPAARMLPS